MIHDLVPGPPCRAVVQTMLGMTVDIILFLVVEIEIPFAPLPVWARSARRIIGRPLRLSSMSSSCGYFAFISENLYI